MKKAAAGLVLAAVVLSGCASARQAVPAADRARAGGAVGTVTAPAAKPESRHLLRVGYVADIPDAEALVGLQDGYLREDLGPGVELVPVHYPTATAESAAIAAGSLGAAYIDPVAAVRAWQSDHGAIRIIAGAAAGCGELVVSGHITSPVQLAGKHLTAPAGTAQQAALTAWLGAHHLAGIASVSTALSGASAVAAFKAGRIAGAWEPAPFDAEMVDAGGRLLASSAPTWSAGTPCTSAVLAVTSKLLNAQPAVVKGLLKAQVQAEDLLATNPTAAREAIQDQLPEHGKGRPIAAAISQVQFTDNPFTAAIASEARSAAQAGILRPIGSLHGLYDLGPLNAILRSAGQLPLTG